MRLALLLIELLIHVLFLRRLAMTTGAATSAAAAFTATAIIMPGNKVAIYMLQGKEQGNSQH